jgi:hypothetical protein
MKIEEACIFPKYTEEDFRLQIAHRSMRSDTVAILDASQTYYTTIGGGLDGLTNWFQFKQKQMKNRFWF